MKNRFHAPCLNKALRPKRSPLRTSAEIAEEIGIPPNRLRGLMKKLDGPKPELDLRACATGKAKLCWYNPEKVKAWYKSLSCVDDV